MTQIKCILKAAGKGNIKISLPMVSTAKELQDAKKIISEASDKLHKESFYTAKKISIGTMIETAAFRGKY